VFISTLFRKKVKQLCDIIYHEPVPYLDIQERIVWQLNVLCKQYKKRAMSTVKWREHAILVYPNRHLRRKSYCDSLTDIGMV
jgi:hypothetical protein